MPSTSKALVAARSLFDVIKQHVSATLPVAVESFDASGNPVITLSQDATPAAGERVVVLRIKPIDRPEAKDVLGLAALQYSGHDIDICTEQNFAGTTDNVADILGPAQLLPILIEAGRTGMVVNWFRSNNGTLPAVAQMTAANLGATWMSLHWNVKAAP